jgi:hypothetical protein
MHVILLPTVPHTGTHFMVEFFKQFQIVQNTVELVQLRKNEYKFAGNPYGFAGLYPDRTNLVYGHVYERELPTLLSLARWWKPIVPLRDPLAGLVTRQNRHPDQTHTHIVNAWLRLVEVVDELEPEYVPLDLLIKPEDRRDAMIRVVEKAKLGCGAWHTQALTWASQWPQNKHNSKGNYPLKEAYRAGDIEALEGVLGHELTQLRLAEPVLRPFLEKQGYKDLLWWS